MAAAAAPGAPHRPPLPAQPSEDVYAALVRTYLDLLCLDNATFLAERYAAAFPRSERAVYLLAHCYYRSGSAKSARSVLLRRWLGTNDSLRGSVEEGDAEAERTRSAARYLLAKCCHDLGMYNEGEESLLRHAREQFAKAVAAGGGTVDGVKIRGNRNEALDAWIVHAARTGAPCPVPNGAAGLQLLGRICAKTNRRERAIEYYRLALTLDPLLWTSYEALCELAGPSESGEEEGEGWAVDDPDAVFGVPAPALSPRHRDAGLVGGAQHGFAGAAGGNGDATADDGAPPPPQGRPSLASFRLNRYGTPSTPYTSFGDLNLGTESSVKDARGVNFHLPPATASTIAPKARGGRPSLPQTNLFAATPAIQEQTPAMETPREGAGGEPPPSSAIGYANQVLDRARRVVAGLAYEPSPESVRRPGAASRTNAGQAKDAEITFSSTPLPSSSGNTPAPFLAGVSTVKGEKRALFATTEEEDKAEGTRKKTPKKADPPKKDQMEGTEERKDETALAVETDAAAESQHVGKVLELLCGLGAAYRCLCQYRSQEALELFRELPPEHIHTGWVQHQIGKAHFEMSDYHNAHRALLAMQKAEPYRMKGLDVLSTTLWQLKKEVELSDLAQLAVDFDRMTPEAWFVVGNCFSLQKEHETAISFFRRAIQLNPSYTYAHTLCGHEFASNEDFDKAIACYRDAIRVDPQHYTAWYGLGAIYFRQEKFDLAEYHFRRALDVNAQSSVLHCHLGMAQHQNGKTQEALDTLAGAFRLDPRNPQAHYQRATIFMALDRPEDALVELERVRLAAPREASVHFNMGKVYKRLGQPSKAMRCFLTALDLDPKDNNLIKAAMDRLDEPDVEEEVSVF